MDNCKKHPKYLGLKEPRVSCQSCWKYFFEINDIKFKHVGRKIRLNIVDLNVPVDKEYIEVVFLGDVHFGSPQCDEDRFRSQIEYCLSKNIYVFLMGDIIEMATRYSIGAGVYEQDETPNLQIGHIVELLKPLADKKLIIGMLSGNHEDRAYKEIGINITDFMASQLNVRSLGYACWNLFRAGKQNYTVYTWHGTSAARHDYTKLKVAIDTANNFDCDLFCMGHVHACMDNALLSQRVDMRDRTIKENKKFIVVTGHYLKYDGGYAQSRGMSPSKLGSPKVKFFTDKHDIHISW